jgi:hypothetical protein
MTTNFSDGNRQAHLHAFLEWLPAHLHDLPGIDWAKLPSPVMQVLMNARSSEHPDVPYIAVGAASLTDAVQESTIKQYVRYLGYLLADLRQTNLLESIHDLSKRDIWQKYTEQTEPSRHRDLKLQVYASVAATYLPDYIERLDPHERSRGRAYVLPPPPPNLLRFCGRQRENTRAAQQRRKAQSDALVPWYSILIALILQRHKAAKQMIERFRQEKARVLAGECRLPHTFSCDVVLPEIDLREDARVRDTCIHQRPVCMKLTMWDRTSWVLDHPEDFSQDMIKKHHRLQDSPINAEHIFLEFEGDADDLLWIGDLVALRLFQRLPREDESPTDQAAQRHTIAADWGASEGITTSRPGLLAPPKRINQWLVESIPWPSGHLVFEPESLHHGILYGAALGIIALTNGSRNCELVQVSLDRAIMRTVPTEKETKIHLQNLLPKGCHTDRERQYFLLPNQVMPLLEEILQGLIHAHGNIPTICPNPQNHKSATLNPERYVFQWATGSRRSGHIAEDDVTLLIRLVLHGLEFKSRDGNPVRITPHLLRHVAATATRYEYFLPPEATASLLHHRQGRSLPSGNRSTIPEATEYYSQKPQADVQAAFQAIQEDIVEADQDALGLQHIDLPEDPDVQTALHQWHTPRPTLFGFCGQVGRCIRGDHRLLCLGCPHLLPDPSKLPQTLQWEQILEEKTRQLRATGHHADARQTEEQADAIRDLRQMMLLLQAASPDELPALPAQGITQLPDTLSE